MREDVDEGLAVTSYATAQRPGDRAFQRDAAALCTAPDGTRARITCEVENGTRPGQCPGHV